MKILLAIGAVVLWALLFVPVRLTYWALVVWVDKRQNRWEGREL